MDTTGTSVKRVALSIIVIRLRSTQSPNDTKNVENVKMSVELKHLLAKKDQISITVFHLMRILS